MEAVFNDMAALANATASSFAQQQRQQVSTIGTIAAASLATIRAPSLSSSSTSLVDVSPSILTSPTLSSVSCESGVIVNGSSHCSSATNSPIASSSVVPSSNTVQKTVTSTPVSSMTVGMLSATLLAAASTPSLSSSATTVSVSRTPVPACSPISSMCPTLLSSTTTASNLAPATSAHQLLINGLSVTDTDMTSVNSNSLAEDPRALQLALELSMVGLNDSLQLQVHQHQLQQLQQQHLQHMQQQQHQKHLQQKQKASTTFDMSSLSAAVAAAAVGTNVSNTHVPSSTAAQLNQFSAALLPGIDDRAKKSQNMTECVPVPSSEHVAEIVGRQGCKIKALRAKTNTYIKTPVRGEEPVFVVTGRKEDVAKAKREILSAAEHFSVIRASRKPSIACSLTGSLNGSGGGCNKTPPGPPSIPGHVTIQVRVPYRVVGLVVGSKGSTIKHIQQETQTYIVTPSREKEPIFDVSGLPDNVQAARKQIEAHIAIRTGAVTGEESVIGGNGITAPTINSLSQILSDDISSEFLASIYKNGLCSTLDYSVGVEANATTSVLPVATHNNCVNLGPSACNSNSQALIHSGVNNSNNFQVSIRSGDFLNGVMSTFEGLDPNHVFNSTLTPSNRSGNTLVGSGISDINLNGNMFSASSNSNGMSRSCSSASSTTSSKSASNSGGSTSSRPELSNIWKNLGDSLDVDEGIGESPNIWTIPGVLQSTPGAHYSSSTTSISPTDSLLRESNTFGQLMAIQNPLQQREILASNNFSSNNLAALQQQQQMLLHNNQQLGLRRECLICNEKEVTAALVPCGHNMFCLECANRICASADSVCPACNQSVFHAMRILP